MGAFAVSVIEFGKWDYRKWAYKPEEKIQEFWKYYEQMVQCVVQDAQRHGGQAVIIIDWDEFGLSHHASKKGKKIAACEF